MNVQRAALINPGYEVRLYNEADMREVLSRHPQVEAFVDKTFQHPSQLSDLLRFCLWKDHGGWYVDADAWCVKSFEDVTTSLGFTGSMGFMFTYADPDWPHYDELWEAMQGGEPETDKLSTWPHEWLKHNRPKHDCQHRFTVEPWEFDYGRWLADPSKWPLDSRYYGIHPMKPWFMDGPMEETHGVVGL
jgi:hypothetical protein